MSTLFRSTYRTRYVFVIINMYLLSGQGQIESLKEVYHFFKYCLRSVAFGITDNKESACPDYEWKVWIKFPASTVVSKSALRNCQDRSFAELPWWFMNENLLNSYSAYTIMRVFVNDPICLKVLWLLQTVIEGCKKNCDRKHIYAHFKKREITPKWHKCRCTCIVKRDARQNIFLHN